LKVAENILEQQVSTELFSLENTEAPELLPQTENEAFKWKRLATICVAAFCIVAIGFLALQYFKIYTIESFWQATKPHINFTFFAFVVVGFLAQMVDGSLGMGYGISCATCLFSLGVPPVAISAAIHTSEIFSTGISGFSHYKFGNVNKKLFKHLVVPGVLGAIFGALLLVFLEDKYGKMLMPFVALYAVFLGVKILIKAFKPIPKNSKLKRVGWLGGIGGFMDSFGGGGWGPIVTSTLIARGKSPRYTIGTVSLSEFFVTLVSAITFFVSVGLSHINIVIGLLIGSTIAAPIAAKLSGKIPRKTMMVGVGLMVIIWSIRMIIKSI
jgi:uncharacterized protein